MAVSFEVVKEAENLLHRERWGFELREGWMHLVTYREERRKTRSKLYITARRWPQKQWIDKRFPNKVYIPVEEVPLPDWLETEARRELCKAVQLRLPEGRVLDQPLEGEEVWDEVPWWNQPSSVQAASGPGGGPWQAGPGGRVAPGPSQIWLMEAGENGIAFIPSDVGYRRR